MVYDYTFHIHIAKQEGIIQYKDRCSSSVTTFFALFNSVQDRAVVIRGLYMPETSHAVLAGAAACLNVLSHSL